MNENFASNRYERKATNIAHMNKYAKDEIESKQNKMEKKKKNQLNCF